MATNERLRAAFKSSGLKQSFVAEEVGMHHTRLSKIVRGHIAPDEIERLRIAGALRRSVSELWPDEVPA